MSERAPPTTKWNWPARCLLIVGGLLVASGIWLFLDDSAAEDFKRASSLPHYAPNQLSALPVGTSLLVEGELAALEPPGPQGFVIYRRESFLRKKTTGASAGREEWMSLGTVTPRVALKGADVVVEMSNSDYVPKNWPHRWQSHVIPHYRDITDVTQRIFGFKAGDLVTVDGRLVGGAAGGKRQLEITALASGDRQAYLGELRGGIMVLKVVGGFFAGIGLLMLAGLLLWRRAVNRRARLYFESIRVRASPSARLRAERNGDIDPQ